jgi:HK97 family phage portal protein
MGLWDRLFKKKGYTPNSFGVFTPVISVGKDVVDLLKGGKSGLLEESMFNSVNVFSAVRVIIDKAKPCPWLLYEIKDQQKQAYYLNYRQKAEFIHKAKEFKTKALNEIQTSPILDLLNKPNNFQTAMQFREDLFGFYNTLGECFIYADMPVLGRNAGRPNALYSLPPHLVEPIYSGDYKNPIKHYIFYFDGKPQEIEPHRICHIKKWNPLYNYTGDGLHAIAPIEVSRNLINREKANQKAQTRAYINGGRAFLISAEQPAADQETMTQEQLDILNDRIKEKLQGPENYMNIQATSASVKVHNIGDSVADMKLIEADKEDLRKVCMIFNVDPILLGLKDGAKYDNQEGAYKALVTQVVMPQQNDITEALNCWLVPMMNKGDDSRKLFLEADGEFYPELQPDAKLMREIYGSGHFTTNEFRSTIGWDAHPDDVSNMMLHPTNIKVISSELLKQQEQNRQRTLENKPQPHKKEIKIKAEILKGCLMFYPDIDINDWVNGIRKLVPNHIVEEYEFEPHLTVLYGFDDTKMNVGKLKYVVNEFIKDNPISIKADRIGLFSNDSDVIKINVEDLNGNLTRLNALVKAQFEYQNDYPDYKPHITIAYTNKGAGAYLDGSLIDLKDYGLKDLNNGLFKYSDSDKKKTSIN